VKNIGVQINDTNDLGQLMDIKIRVQRDETGKIVTGMVIGDTLEQNKALLLLLRPGDLKDKPLIGVGIEDILLSDETNLTEYRHKIRRNLESDGMRVGVVDFYNKTNLKIEAYYE